MQTDDPLGALNRAIEAAGGSNAALARKISDLTGENITREAIRFWVKSGRAPAERCRQIEAVTGVSASELRPDVFRPWGGSEPTEAA